MITGSRMLTRRNMFRGSLGLGLAAGLGTTPPAKPHDALTVDDILRATAMLRENNVPRFGGDGYRMFLHPNAAEDVALDNLTMDASYRVRETAWSIMQHERRRQAMGKRGHVTATECLARAGVNVATIAPGQRGVRGVKIDVLSLDEAAPFDT